MTLPPRFYAPCPELSFHQVTGIRWCNTSCTAGDASVDLIVVDMPWGKRCSSPKLNRMLYPKLLRGISNILWQLTRAQWSCCVEWYRVLRPNGHLFALTLERKLVLRLLDQLALDWQLVDRVQATVGFKVRLA